MAFTYNPFTGNLDYYQVASSGGGVYVPLPKSLQMFGDFRGIYNVGSCWQLLNMNRGSGAYPSGITINSIFVDSNVNDPTTELAATLKYCDGLGTGAFPGSNVTTISSLNTTTGNYSNTNVGSTVPVGKIMFMSLDDDPTDFNTMWSLVINYTII